MVRFGMKINKIHSILDKPAIIPDFTVDTCPFGCTRECERIWINNVTGHRIICTCKICHENEKDGLDNKIKKKTNGVGFTAPQHQTHSTTTAVTRESATIDV